MLLACSLLAGCGEAKRADAQAEADAPLAASTTAGPAAPQPPPTARRTEGPRLELEGVHLGMMSDRATAQLQSQGWRTEGDRIPSYRFERGDFRGADKASITLQHKLAGLQPAEAPVVRASLSWTPDGSRLERYARAEGLLEAYVARYGEPDGCLAQPERPKAICTWTRRVGDEEQTLRWNLDSLGRAHLRLASERGVTPAGGFTPAAMLPPPPPGRLALEALALGMPRDEVRSRMEAAGYDDVVLKGDAGTQAYRYGTTFQLRGEGPSRPRILVSYGEDERATRVEARQPRDGATFEAWRAALAERHGAPSSCSDPGGAERKAGPQIPEPQQKFLKDSGVRLETGRVCTWEAQGGSLRCTLEAKESRCLLSG